MCVRGALAYERVRVRAPSVRMLTWQRRRYGGCGTTEWRLVLADIKYKRVLLKLSGEALMGSQSFGIDPAVPKRLAEEIR